MEQSFSYKPNHRLDAKIIPVEPFDLVVFGGTGDLALRKLIPALYYRYSDGQMPAGSKVIGVSRTKLSREAYIERLKKNILLYVEQDDFKESIWQEFAQFLHYIPLNATGDTGWKTLVKLFRPENERVRIFYLSVPPHLFGLICSNIQKHELVTQKTRVVIEKPIGRDLATAKEINNAVGEVFQEQQIYRIDHYLGKETVQNLMALRFANSLFEPLWNRQHVDHVQITVAESLGIGSRGGYYDSSGALRDMVQNHLLQLLCLVAMEPPKSFQADFVRVEKLKVLHSLSPFASDQVKTRVVFGQYGEGAVDGKPVTGYHQEAGIHPESNTETYVALKAQLDTWRWSGVPFYLRTGKRMPKRTSEIVIEFRSVPHLIFPANVDQMAANRLVIRLQPNEGVRLYLMSKVPGPGGFRMQVVPLNLSFAETFKLRYPDGYERLLMDVVRGNQTLFMHRDEVEASWIWAESILNAWQGTQRSPQLYTAGTWGPTGAIALIERDNRTWYEYGV